MTGKLIARGAFFAAIGFILLTIVGISRAAETFVLPTGTYGQPYTYILTGDDGVPPYSFHKVSGTLPTGVYLTSNGVISGTPTASGVFEIRVSIDDSAGAPTEYGDLSLTISSPPLAVSDTSVQAAYNKPIDIDVTPLITGDWDEIQVNGASYGYPTVSGSVVTYTPIDNFHGSDEFNLDVYNMAGGSYVRATVHVEVLKPAAPVAHDLSVTQDDTSPGIIIDLTPHIEITEPIWYSTIIGAASKGDATSGGGTEILYNANSTAEGTDTFSYTVTDYLGQESNVATVTVELMAPGAVITLPPMSLTAKVGDPFSQVISASGGAAPYTYGTLPFLGPLPDGISLDGDTLKGTPTTEGSYPFLVTVTDADGIGGSALFLITVTAADPVAAAPVTTDASANVDFNAETATDINLASHTTGDFDTFQIVGHPAKGAVLDNGMFVSYTPTKGATGTDTFTFTATGPGGVSNVSTVTITISATPVIDLPVAVDHEVHLSPTESGSVDLTTGATGAPFLRATIIGTVPADVGKFSLNGTTLSFTPHVAFDGTAKIGYVLENAAGTSNVAEVRFIVASRSDPTKDPEIIGLLTAQAEAAKKLADDQITTITGRMESLHNEGYCNRQNAIDLRLGFAAAGDNPDDHSKDGGTLSGKTAADCKWAIWGGGYVSLADYDRNHVDFSSTSVGLTAGIDYRFTPSFVGGIALGYGSEESSIGSHGTTSAAQAISAALYASWHPSNGMFIDGIIGYQHLSYDSTRYVTDNGEFAYGKRSGSQVFGSLTAGYEIRKDGFLIAPYVGVLGSHALLSGFSETGGGIHGLTYGEQAVTSISGVVGIRAEYDIIKPWGVLTPSIRAEYRHDFVGDSDVSLGYTDTGEKPYRAEIKGRGKDSVTVGVGLKAKVSKGWTIESTLSTTLGNGKPSYRIGVTATYKFCGLFIPQSACGPQAVEEPVKGKAAKKRKLRKIR